MKMSNNFMENFEYRLKNDFKKEIFNLERGSGTSSKLFDFYDEITNFGIMFKFEKLPSYSQILNIEKCIFFNILAIGIEKEENRKKGFFKNTIKILEDFCKENGISLLISNILDDNLVKTLNKNGFGIISLGYTNRVSVFEDILDDDDDQHYCIMNDILKKSYEIHSFKIFKKNPNSDTAHA